MLHSISNTYYLPGKGLGILMVFSEDRAWPKDEGRTQDKRHSFSHTDQPWPMNNFFFLARLLSLLCCEWRGKFQIVVRIIKSWIFYERTISQKVSRIKDSGPQRCLKKVILFIFGTSWDDTYAIAGLVLNSINSSHIAVRLWPICYSIGIKHLKRHMTYIVLWIKVSKSFFNFLAQFRK